TDMQEPSKKDEAREVKGHAPGEEEGSRTGRRLVVVNQGQLEAGRNDHDAAENRQEDITEGIEGQPGPAFLRRSFQGILGPRILAFEIQPPEQGGKAEATDDAAEAAQR